MSEVHEAVREQVLPGDEEREQNRDMFAKIRSFIKDEFGRDARLMGSTAKDTFMAGDKDLDVFVFFPPDLPEDELEAAGLEIGEAVFEEFDGSYAVEYAEHPYTKGVIDGYEVEIVPAYDVPSGEEIKSAVDRTPFHTEWVDEQLSSEEKEEVVVLKAFLRGQDLYGSTLKIEGFSGYLCELLIAVYGNFENVVAAAVDWEEQEMLDPAEHHDELSTQLQKKFADDGLIVIDPVDPERNVAAVLSPENYARFIYAAWQYIESPDTEFFFPEQEEADEDAVAAAAAHRGDFVVVSFPVPDLVDDILYPQIRRLMRRLETVLEKADFRLFETGFHVGEEVRLVFELYTDQLPATRKQVGPRVFHNQVHIEQFTEKYEQVWVEDDRLVTLVDREHPATQHLLEEFFTGDLQEKGVPAQLVPVVEQYEITDLPVDGAAWRTFLKNELKLG